MKMKKQKNEEEKVEQKGLVKSEIRFTRRFSSDSRLEILFYTIEAVERNKGFIHRFKKNFQQKFARKEKEEKPAVTDAVERYNTEITNGLSDEQVQARIDANLENSTKVKSSKSYASIFFKNIFTCKLKGS